MNSGDVIRAFEAPPAQPQAVLAALSLKRVSDSPFAAVSPDVLDRIVKDSVTNAISAMKNFGTKRIVILSQWGAGNSSDSMNFLFRAIFKHINMKYGMAAHNALDKETRQAGVDLVLGRAYVLVEGDAAPIKVYPDDSKLIGFLPKITRASVAKTHDRSMGEKRIRRQEPGDRKLCIFRNYVESRDCSPILD